MRRYKGTLAFGIIFLIAGVIMLVVAYSNGASAFNEKYTQHTYTASGVIDRYNLDMAAGNFVTEFYDGDTAVIEYSQSSKYYVTVHEEHGVLTVKAKYEWWVLFNFHIGSLPQTTIKIPKHTVPDIGIDISAGKFKLGDGSYGNVDTELSAGTLTIGNIDCRNLKCDMSAGNINIAGANCEIFDLDVSAGSVNISEMICNSSADIDLTAGSANVTNFECPKIAIDVSAGDVNLGFTDKEENYTISVDKSAGSCNVDNRTSNTGKSLKIDISAGKVICNFQD